MSRLVRLGAQQGVMAGSAPVRSLSLKGGPDDAALVARALAGDRWAEEVIYRRHVRRLTQVVTRLLRHGPDIEDVVQDTFIDAYRDLAQLRDPSHLERWLLRIAVHKVHRRFRRQRLRRLLGMDHGRADEPLALQASAHASQETRTELALLDEVLDRMPGPDRACWVLQKLEGHRLQEVAELSRCSLATAKRRIARADALVRAHFAGVDHE